MASSVSSLQDCGFHDDASVHSETPKNDFESMALMLHGLENVRLNYVEQLLNLADRMDAMVANHADERMKNQLETDQKVQKLMEKIDQQQQLIDQLNKENFGLRAIHEKNKDFLGSIDGRK